MEFHPKNIKLDHVLRAVSRIEREGIELVASTKYDVVIDGKKYPPKEIMRFARYELDKSYDWNYGGGEPTNKYLREMGLEIGDKDWVVQDTTIRVLIINLTWNSLDWKGTSEDKSNHRWVKEGNIPHESWNFDFTNERNPQGKVLGYAKFTNPPKVSGDDNLLFFHSDGKIVGIYGKAEVLNDYVDLNDNESYNLIADLSHSILFENKIDNIKEKGFLDGKKKMGQIGFNYINTPSVVLNILDTAMELNPNQIEVIQRVKDWYTKSNSNIISRVNTMGNHNIPLNQILYGPPGTGKTYNTINKAISIINPSFDLSQDRAIVKDEFNRLVQDSSIRFITFHQSFSYEDFVEGIKPKTIKKVDEEGAEKQDIVYEIEDGIFKQLCIAANVSECNLNSLVDTYIGKNRIANVSSEVLTIEKPRGGNLLIPIKLINELVAYVLDNKIDFSYEKQVVYNDTTAKREDYPNLEPYMVNGYENLFPELVKIIRENIKGKNNQNYVLIIDEINRGNIASIFGELITLIEEDKREGGGEALSTILPYSKEKFSVPSNVYILGTMNTADRSVEALDIALRRRFSFIEMAPDSSKIENEIVGDINLRSLLDIINLRIEKLLDKDHRIGHAYFMNVKSLDELKDVFADKVIPLLEEYFFGDYSKIGLVLGRSFVQRAEFDSDFSFADFDNDDQSDLLDKPIYELTDWENWDFNSIL